MPCSTCPDESVQQDEASPGPIAGEELLCRGAFGKSSHYNSAGVKPKFINDRDLLAGCLSVWRMPETRDNLEKIREILSDNAPPRNSLWDIFSCTAETLREIRAPSSPAAQALHAYDDCIIDAEGGKDPDHASLAICRNIGPDDLAKDTPVYVEIRDLLFLHLTQGNVWTLPVDQRT